MIKYAAIKDNKVVNLIVFENPSLEELSDVANAMEVDLLIPLTVTGAGIGSDYINGEIRPVQPYFSWTWDTGNKKWVAPVAMPTDKQVYAWNEDTKSWDVITPPTK
jgi:hypothetical protein